MGVELRSIDTIRVRRTRATRAEAPPSAAAVGSWSESVPPTRVTSEVVVWDAATTGGRMAAVGVARDAAPHGFGVRFVDRRHVVSIAPLRGRHHAEER